MTMRHPTSPARAWRAWLAGLLLAALIPGCGGGVGTGGTGSFSYFSGPITGLGSIVVGGVRIDIDAAEVRDLDQASRDRSELRLGTTVQVEAGAVDASTTPPTAVATRVVIGSELVGRVESPPATAAGVTTLVVAGQTVVLAASTVVDNRFVNGLASITTGTAVEVYGFFDSRSGQVTATRIEPARSAAPATYQVRGTVSALSTAGKTFQIGAAVYVYTSAPAALANGAVVRLTVSATQDGNGRWVVQSFDRAEVELPDSDRAEVEGRIDSFTSNASFVVNGVPVDASAVTVSGLAVGVKVEVKGALRGGVLVASRIEVDDDASGGSGGAGSGSDDTEFEFHGTIAPGSVNTSAKTFRLTGRTEVISYARADLVVKGNNASLALIEAGTPRQLEVKGVLAADRVTIEATEIEVED